MTVAQFNATLKKLELSQVKAARVLAIARASVIRYANDQTPCP